MKVKKFKTVKDSLDHFDEMFSKTYKLLGNTIEKIGELEERIEELENRRQGIFLDLRKKK